MAMTPKQKVGIGYAITGALFVLVGAVFYFISAVPTWVAPVVQIVGLVGNYLGFKVILPDTNPPA